MGPSWKTRGGAVLPRLHRFPRALLPPFLFSRSGRSDPTKPNCVNHGLCVGDIKHPSALSVPPDHAHTHTCAHTQGHLRCSPFIYKADRLVTGSRPPSQQGDLRLFFGVGNEHRHLFTPSVWKAAAADKRRAVAQRGVRTKELACGTTRR